MEAAVRELREETMLTALKAEFLFDHEGTHSVPQGDLGTGAGQGANSTERTERPYVVGRPRVGLTARFVQGNFGKARRLTCMARQDDQSAPPCWPFSS